MKYLFIFLTSLILISPVYAVAEVKGTVPDTPQLQQGPVGVYPNLNGNVQHSANSQIAPLPNSPGELSTITPNNEQQPIAEPIKKSSHWLLWVLFSVVVLLILGWWKYGKISKTDLD